MTVQDLIDTAQHGELKQLSVGDDLSAVISFVNLGVLELHKRFILETEEIIIELGVATDGTSPYQMISDTVYQMPDGMMYVTAAYDEEGNRLPVNREDEPLSVNTITWDKIQVPVANVGSYISVIYTAAPKIITGNGLASKVPVPPQLIEALLHYMGYRAHGAVDGLINEENNTHYQRFEASCNRAREYGLQTADDIATLERLSDRCFA